MGLKQEALMVMAPLALAGCGSSGGYGGSGDRGSDASIYEAATLEHALVGDGDIERSIVSGDPEQAGLIANPDGSKVENPLK